MCVYKSKGWKWPVLPVCSECWLGDIGEKYAGYGRQRDWVLLHYGVKLQWNGRSDRSHLRVTKKHLKNISCLLLMFCICVTKYLNRMSCFSYSLNRKKKVVYCRLRPLHVRNLDTCALSARPYFIDKRQCSNTYKFFTKARVTLYCGTSLGQAFHNLSITLSDIRLWALMSKTAHRQPCLCFVTVKCDTCWHIA